MNLKLLTLALICLSTLSGFAKEKLISLHRVYPNQDKEATYQGDYNLFLGADLLQPGDITKVGWHGSPTGGGAGDLSIKFSAKALERFRKMMKEKKQLECVFFIDGECIPCPLHSDSFAGNALFFPSRKSINATIALRDKLNKSFQKE